MPVEPREQVTRTDLFGQPVTGGAGWCRRKAAAFVGGMSRVSREAHARFCERCALKAHGIQLPEMATAAKPSSQPRTESCVVAPTALRSVDREGVGRNASERKDNPEIDRGRSSRPYLSMGKAETQAAVGRVTWDASGVRAAGMQPKGSMGTRESRPIQAMTCKVRQADTARET